MKKYFIAALLLALPLMCGAQWRREPTPNDTLRSTVILQEGGVVFQIYAPKASSVTVSGDIGMPVVLAKENNGVWKGRVPKIGEGVYRYHFVVDGVNVYDPKSPQASETSALLTVAPRGDESFAMKDVPHGTVAERWYYSSNLKTTRRLHVWTPAGYETSKEKLPVFYLIHGGGDTDNAWTGPGAANWILDNLLAEGKIVPMVVVMPNGSIQTDSMEGEVPLFTEDLMHSIIPFIEANYRVKTGSADRALAGLSMGGLETLETMLPYYRDFDWFGVLSSGWFADQTELYKEKAKVLNDIAADFNKNVKMLTFHMGGPEDIAYNNCKAMLKLFDAAGIKYTYVEGPGGHSWITWRRDLYQIAPLLFR